MKIIKMIGDILPVPSYSVLIICFFLPFFTVKCSDTELLSVTGFEMMKGVDFQQEMKNSDLSKGLGNDFSDNSSEDENTEEQSSDSKQKPSIILIIPFVLGILGLIFSFIKNKKRSFIHVVLSALIFLCLLVFGVGLKNNDEINMLDTMGEASGNLGNSMGDGIISVGLSGAYFVACFFALLILFYFAFEIYMKTQIIETKSVDDSQDRYQQFLNKDEA